MSDTMDRAIALVKEERARQDAKWGEQNHPPCEWMTVLGEEFGEACQAALNLRFGGKLTQADYQKEVVQVAAVAVAMVECLMRGKWKEPTDEQA